MTPKGLWLLGRFYLKKNNIIDKVTLELVKNKGFFGRCTYYCNPSGGPATEVKVQLSLHNLLVMPFAEVKDTVLHEIAHAIDALENGDSSHGPRWKRIARLVGATPKAKTKTGGNAQYVIMCNACNSKIGSRHRLTKSMKIKVYDGRCGKCGSPDIKLLDTIAKRTVVDSNGIHEPYLI